MEFRGMSQGRMSSGTSICASSRMEWRSHADGGMSNTQDDNNEDLPVCTFSKHQHLRDHIGLGKDLTFPAYSGLAQSDVVESQILISSSFIRRKSVV